MIALRSSLHETRLDSSFIRKKAFTELKPLSQVKRKTSSKKALREKVVPCLSDGEPPTASSNSETGTGLLTLPFL